MEKEINIAEILQNKPKGTKLWSPIFGDCVLGHVDKGNNEIEINIGHQALWTFAWNGHTSSYPEEGEVMLFPSKSMLDWSKFAWKKGDVLVSNDGKVECIFEKFTDDSYTAFSGRHYLDSTDDANIVYASMETYLVTSDFSIEDKDVAQCYINTIEERLGGKLNLDTLEIEKKQNYQFKPFERVLVRDLDDVAWKCGLFSHYEEDSSHFACVGSIYKQCIPYEGNEKLLGTTDNWED